jgi:hypothetical protein
MSFIPTDNAYMAILIPHFASLSAGYAATLDSLDASDAPHLSAWLARAKVVAQEPLAEDAELLKARRTSAGFPGKLAALRQRRSSIPMRCQARFCSFATGM